jgi:hypothetical protein
MEFRQTLIDLRVGGSVDQAVVAKEDLVDLALVVVMAYLVAMAGMEDYQYCSHSI